MMIRYQSIGTLYSPFRDPVDMPIQPPGAAGVRGTLAVDPRYLDGLKDLEGFSHIYVLYHFHQSGPTQLTVTPFMDSVVHGIFATRAPRRPNPIGLSVLRLSGIVGNLLQLEDVDILNGTPVLDIKPYVPTFDHPGEVRSGWLEHSPEQVGEKRSDERFS